MGGWSNEQVAVAAIGSMASLSLLVAMLLARTSFSLRRLAALLVVALALATIVWTLGGADVSVGRTLTFVATCTSPPVNVGASVIRLQGQGNASRILLLDHGRDTCDAAAVATAASLPGRSVSVASVGESSDGPSSSDSSINAALRKAVIKAAGVASVSTLVVLYDARDSWWNDEFVKALRHPAITERLRPDLYFANVDDNGQAYKLDISFIGTLQPIILNTIDNPVRLRLTGGPDTSSDTQNVDLCFGLDAAVDWPTCSSSDDVLVLEDVPLRRIARGSAPNVPSWEWQGSGINPFQDLIFGRAGDNSGRHVCDPMCNRGLAAKKLSAGWHTLRVLAHVRTAGNTATVAPVHLVIFVGSTGATVIVGTDETLAARGWPAPTPTGGFARPLLKEAIANTPRSTKVLRLQRFIAFPRPPSIPAGLPLQGDCIIRTDAPATVIDACLSAARAAIIIEPDKSFLYDFLTPRVAGLLKGGTAITIAGVPSVDRAHEQAAEAWLPAWPEVGTGVVETQRQVLLVADCSALAHMATEDTKIAMNTAASPSAYADQNEIIQALEKSLRAQPNGAPVQLGDAEAKVVRFERKSGWQPSLTVGFAPGCLRNETDEIRNERELVNTAVLEQRINAFVPSGAEALPAPYPTFRLDGTRYPGSAMVVFSTEAAQYEPFLGIMRRSGGAVVDGGLAAKWTGVQPSIDLMKRLEEGDIKVVIVELPTNPRFKAIADGAKQPTERSWHAALADWRTHRNVAVVTHGANADPATTASAILHELETPIASGVHREHFGRTMDPRVPDNVPVVPEAFRPLTMHAGRRLQALGPEYRNALLSAERNDRGAPVVALAYSPFDPVSWASDVGSETALSDHFAAVCGTPCALNSWLTTFSKRTLAGTSPDTHSPSSALGIQRYFDAASQSMIAPSRPSLLTLETLELSTLGDQLRARFHLPGVGIGWSDPTVGVPDAPKHCGARAIADGCPMVLAEVDPASDTATYTFSTTEGLPAPVRGYEIRVSGKREAVVPFWLTKRDELSPDAAPFLNLMRAAGATHATASLSEAKLSALPIAAIVLSVLTAALFTPLVRPWHALAQLRRMRRRADQTAIFDVDFVSELAGARPAAYEASRRAGDPAFMRRMQAGDSLSRAVVGDLALMSNIGGSVGAVVQLPRVRLREIGESFDLVIAVDDAPSLLLPGDLYGKSRKRFAAVGLVSVICGTATRQRGRFSIVALRGSTSVLRIDQFDSDMVEAIFDEMFRDGGSRDAIRNPAELPPTAVRLVVSDFLSSTPAEYVAWTQGARSAAIHVFDAEQGKEIGIGRDARTGRIYDRSVWEVGDAAALVRQRATKMRYALDQSGVKYVAIDVEMSNAEVAAALSQSGMLDLTQQK